MHLLKNPKRGKNNLSLTGGRWKTSKVTDTETANIEKTFL
jgi:hypothetical protein